MSTAAYHPVAGEYPMPEPTVRGLRAAVRALMPDRSDAYEQAVDQAVAACEDAGSLAPLRVLHLEWGAWVAIARVPARAARLRELDEKGDALGLMELLDEVRPEVRA